jgi:hypothetical protein
MIASQKKLAMAESHINFGLHRTCMKNSITNVIFVKAMRSATSVLAPGKIKSRSITAT